ncbi:Ribosome-recycling factor, mitochondrial [Anthophora quadrimaculata]
MSLCCLKSQIVELNYLIKGVKYLHYLNGYKNVSILSKLTNVHSTSHDISSKLCGANKFSTTNALPKSKDRFKEKKTVVHVDSREIAEFVRVERMISQFDEAIENFKDEMIKHLSLRTRVGSLEGLSVMFENEEYNLEELVEISRKPNMVVLNVSSFPEIIPNIMESLRKSQMNLNPQQEGTTIYIQLPKVTKEHREHLAKTAKQYFVKCKDAISEIRNQHIRELKRHANVPTDLVYRGENYIGAMQKEYVSKAEQLLKAKQKELLGES